MPKNARQLDVVNRINWLAGWIRDNPHATQRTGWSAYEAMGFNRAYGTYTHDWLEAKKIVMEETTKTREEHNLLEQVYIYYTEGIERSWNEGQFTAYTRLLKDFCDIFGVKVTTDLLNMDALKALWQIPDKEKE